MPRTRKGFQTQVPEKYRLRLAELDEAIGEMLVRGVSTRGVGGVVETLTGSKPGALTASRVFYTLGGGYQEWEKRSLETHHRYAIADGGPHLAPTTPFSPHAWGRPRCRRRAYQPDT